jgi:hypothetical protein
MAPFLRFDRRRVRLVLLAGLVIGAFTHWSCSSTRNPDLGPTGVGGASGAGGVTFNSDGGAGGEGTGDVGGHGCVGGLPGRLDGAAIGTPFDCGPVQCAVDQTYCHLFMSRNADAYPDTFDCVPFPASCPTRDCSVVPSGGQGATYCDCSQAASGAITTACHPI